MFIRRRHSSLGDGGDGRHHDTGQVRLGYQASPGMLCGGLWRCNGYRVPLALKDAFAIATSPNMEMYQKLGLTVVIPVSLAMVGNAIDYTKSAIQSHEPPAFTIVTSTASTVQNTISGDSVEVEIAGNAFTVGYLIS